jgi:hypothetical protein
MPVIAHLLNWAHGERTDAPALKLARYLGTGMWKSCVLEQKVRQAPYHVHARS